MKSANRKNLNYFSSSLIKRLLQNRYIQNKHLVVYLLEYIGDYGSRDFLRSAFHTLKVGGPSAILHPRRLILNKINNKGAGRLLPTHPLQIAADLESLRLAVPKFAARPKISIILPVFNTNPVLLQAAIESVKSQVYVNWELCIADDCSTVPAVHTILKVYAVDERIRTVFLAANAGISAASNAAIELATGEYIALLDHDDVLTPDALYWIVSELNDAPDTDILYSDECKVDEQGSLSDYFFKPDWSPELLLNMMYTGHLTVYRKNFLLKEIGLFRSAYDFSQDYDLMLRASEKTMRIRHIKKVLYHWRITKGSASQGDKPFARTTNLAALDDAMRRRNIPARVTEWPAANRVQLLLPEQPAVSIVIPTDSIDNLKETLEGIYTLTGYPNYEVVVVCNSLLITEMEGYVNQENLLYVPYDLPYNFSDKCNHGAEAANGSILIFLNDDVRPLQQDWVEQTIEYLYLPGAGAVSPKLIYENDTLQYAGMTTAVRNFVGTTFHTYQRDSVAYHHFPQLVRNVSVLSGACLAIKKDIFNEIGGFDAVNTPSAHSDVDLSFKVRESGLRNIYTPYAVLRHIGHLSLHKHEKNLPWQKDKADIFMLKKWMRFLPDDPYFTDPMKNYLYHDSPEPFNVYGYQRQNTNSFSGDILVVTHDLSRSGAPLNLYDLCTILQSNGYFVVVCSPVNGPLKELYVRKGISVIVDALLLSQADSVNRFARNFDFILCNTIVTWPFVQQMQDSVPTIWWLQEGRAIDVFARQYQQFAETLRTANTVIGLSEYAMGFIRKYNSNAVKIYNTCIDIYDPALGKTNNVKVNQKLIISLVGSIEKRKGQDILIEALDQLDTHAQSQLEIRFIGRIQDPRFMKKLQRMAAKKNFIRFLGEVSHADCQSLIGETDLLVNASRDEAFSVALVEGFCLAKPCIVAEQTGIAELIEDSVNGFVFRQNDATDLAVTINKVLQHTGQLSSIGLAARKTYEAFLSVPAFEKNFLRLLSTETINIEYATAVV